MIEPKELMEALRESIKLQSHYAVLLNGWDGGERMSFANAEEWLDRLRFLKNQNKEGVSMMDYREQGLIPNRYQIRRGDGSPTDPDAKFFVLRYDKPDSWGDACRVALRTLCDEIGEEYPKLAQELRRQVLHAVLLAAGRPFLFELLKPEVIDQARVALAEAAEKEVGCRPFIEVAASKDARAWVGFKLQFAAHRPEWVPEILEVTWGDV